MSNLLVKIVLTALVKCLIVSNGQVLQSQITPQQFQFPPPQSQQSVLQQQPQIIFQQQQQQQQQQLFNSDDQIMNNVVEEVSDHVAKVSRVNVMDKNAHNYCKFTPTTEKIGLVSNMNMRVYEIMALRHSDVPKKKVREFLSARLPEFCQRESNPATAKCDPQARYRTIDGTCNNLDRPYWGAAFTQFSRLIPAYYEDGFGEPRGGMRPENFRLPNPRQISTTIHPDLVHPHSQITNLVPQFGQFLDHDMTLSPEGDRRCCSTQRGDMDCWPIEIFPNDPFYSNLTVPQTCMDFTRSTPYCFPTKSGMREQMNIVTAFLDCSHVYHSELHKAKQLREFFGGRLRVHSKLPELMPVVEEVEHLIGEKIELKGHFLGGEERVNEMPALTVMHTLLVREHNRIADSIRERRPTWPDERIFQESRRILIAQWQNVVYDEYLPIILGKDTMERFHLNLGFIYSAYDPQMDPSIFHSFATAAYRFGHTLINGLVRLMRGLMDVGSYRLRDNFFNPAQLYRDNGRGYDLILNGLTLQNAMDYDPFVTEDLTNFLLREKHQDHGGDLIARNVQRGRDHGLQSYNVYRQICHMPALGTWAQRPQNIRQEVWFKLQNLYENTEDIDLFTGGLAEVPAPGAISGATFNCLKAMQFYRVKFGDRFFFTHGGVQHSFKPDQMRELRRRTLGDLICLNSRMESTSINVFKVHSSENPLIPCSDPRRNLNIDLFLDP